MSFQTKLDLSQQSRIPTGQTADWKGSVNIGETLRIGGFEINPRSPFVGSTLLFDGFTQSYKSGKIIGDAGIVSTYDGTNLILSFTGNTAIGPRLESINNLTTDGIMVSSGTNVSTVALSGTSDFVITNPSGISGSTVLFGLSNTGVSGGTYGSNTIIPSITVDDKGRVIGVSGNTINVITYLSGLTDVSLIQPVADKAILMYDNNVDLWFNGSVAQALGYTPVAEGRTLTINGESYDLTTDRSWTIDTMTKICPNIVTLSGSPYYTASYGDSVYVDTDAVADNCTITLPTGDTYGGLVYVKNMAEPSTYTVSVSSYVLQNGQWILLRKGKFGAWEIIASSLIDTQSVQNGLKIENNTIKLGGELTDDNTRLTVNSPNKNFFIGAPVNGQDLGFISLSSTVFNLNNAVDHDTVQGNTLYITPGGLNSINQFQSGVQTVLNANPEAVVMRYGDNKLINLYIFGGGIIPAGGETLTINDITFTEGIDFIGEGNYVLDTTNILNTLNWNSIPNFVSVAQKTDSFNEPYLEVIFSEIAVVTTTISNLSISNFANENKMLVDKDGVLLRSRNNEITLTNDITSINAKNFNIVQNNEEGVIKNTLYLNAFGSFLSNLDATDSSISSSSISGGFGSNISNFNNKKIGLKILGEILSGESFTINGITFTEGVDFTTVNDPNLDALAIANIDYSSVPNFVSVSSLNDVITFIFSTIDNTIVSNITNSDVANYLFTTSVFAGKDFALMQSNNSGLQIGDAGHIFIDNSSDKQGIRYAGDYSATYTDRSLIDKAYADSLNTNALDKDTVKLAENINKGQAVYVSGANGTNIIVSKASNTSEATSSKTFGLLETSGVTNDIVNVVTRGLLTGLDTSAATVGDAVWLGTNGDLLYGLANKPYAPAHLVFIGVVTRHHAVNGEIFVNVQNGFELNEIHNVSITTPTDNQALIYETSSGIWKNKDITAVGTIGTGTWQGTPIADAYIASADTWNAKLGPNGGTLTGALNYAPSVTIASSATTDIGNANSNNIIISGTTTITSFGTVADGVVRIIRFTGALTLTHNGTSLILPNSSNITTQANDTAIFRSLGLGNWVCISYKSVTALTNTRIPCYDSTGKFINTELSYNGTSIFANTANYKSFIASGRIVSNSNDNYSFQVGNESTNAFFYGIGSGNTGVLRTVSNICMSVNDNGVAIGTGSVNALTQLDLQSTTKGLGLNLVPGDLGTTRNGLIWYDTVGNLFKGVQNGSVVSLLSGSGLTTNNTLKWNGSQIVNANETDDGTTITTTLNRVFTGASASNNGTGANTNKFRFNGVNTIGTGSFIQVDPEMQFSAPAVGGNLRGILYLDASANTYVNNGYTQLFLNSGGDLINSKISLRRAIYINHRSADNVNNGNHNSSAVTIDATMYRPQIGAVSIGASGVHHITSVNADNYSSIIQAGSSGLNPIHYSAYSQRDNAIAYNHNKDATVSSGILNHARNALKSVTTSFSNGFGFKIENFIATSNVSTYVNLQEEYVVQNVGAGTTTSGKIYRHINLAGGTASAYIMGLYAGGVIIGNTTALPNALCSLDLDSTTTGLGLNRVAGGLGTTRNGLIWYDTVGNLFKGVQNGSVVNLLTGSGLTNNYLPRWNGSAFVNSNFFVNSNESFVQGSGLYIRNTSGTNIVSFTVGTTALVDITSQLQLRVSGTGVIVADATNFGILRNLQMYDNTGGYMSQLYNGTGATSAWFSKSVRIGDGTGTPTVANALTCLDLASTTLGLGLNLIAGDLSTTRNGLIWYDTVGNLFKGVQNGSVVSFATLTGIETLTNKTLTTPNIASIKGTLTSNTDGATITFNKNTSDFHNVVLGDNRTLALSNMTVGDRIVIRLTQDATGSRTVTWFTTIKWAGGTVPTLTTTANKADVFGFLCTGTNAFDGFVIGQNI